jgi:oligoendopeptidase F
MEQKSSFVDSNLVIESFADLKPYYDQLLERQLKTNSEVWQWLLDCSELDSFVEEDFAWRYIKSTCNTEDAEAKAAFDKFVTDIEPEITLINNKIEKRFLSPEVQLHIDKAKLFTMVRSIRNSNELFREENVKIEAELQQAEQEFGAISAKMTVDVDGRTMTMQQASNYMKTASREKRKEVYESMIARRMADKPAIDSLIERLMNLRNTIAANTGFDCYTDFRFRQLGRFDYTVADCRDFHQSVADIVVPLVDEINERRRQMMGIDVLRPYDMPVDLPVGITLKPFESTDDLVRKATLCFRDIDPEMGMIMNTMARMGRLDLESRVGKAPGGYNYPLYRSNTAFIFMNATGNLHDMVTLMHEGGHAVHAFLCANQPLVNLKDTPAEVAELASMSMELITMSQWHHFFSDEKQLKMAKLNQMEDVISGLPWIAAVDKFQHYLYENKGNTAEQRTQAWRDIMAQFGSRVVDYSGYEDAYNNKWQRQLHIFELPFYYIEYGFAQLGAISIWKRYTENPQQAIADFKKALSLGYSHSIPEIYEAAGIKFCFTPDYIAGLMDFVKAEMKKLQDGI